MNTTETSESKYYENQEIPAPEEWFQDGFYFAINYLNAWVTALGEETGVDFNGENFKSFVKNFVGKKGNGDDIIPDDDNYFEKFKFYVDQVKNESYPEGQVPNPKYPPVEPEHIPISDGIKGVPRPNKRATEWLATKRKP